MTVWAVVVAAGTGHRFGGPKQFAPLKGRRVLDWAVDAARPSCQGIVVVVPAGEEDSIRPDGVHAVVPGGASRSDSVRRGLAAVPATAEIVVVHDAARPLAQSELFQRVIDAVRRGADGAVPALAVSDTLKAIEDGDDGAVVTATVHRSGLVAVQTPQAFRAAALRDAHASGDEATDDAALVEAAGGRVVTVPGDPRNLKLTGPDDLALAEALAQL